MLIQQLLYAESNSWQPGGHKYAPESTVLSGKLVNHWELALTMKNEQKGEKETNERSEEKVVEEDNKNLRE